MVSLIIRNSYRRTTQSFSLRSWPPPRFYRPRNLYLRERSSFPTVTATSNTLSEPDTHPLSSTQPPSSPSPKLIPPTYKPLTQARTIPSLLLLYSSLIKSHLTSLVVLTAMSGYAMAPPGTGSVSTLLFTTLGTTLCVSSANSLNQWIEPPYDAQMARTRNRVIPRRALSPLHAFTFGAVTGITGIGILGTCVNGLTASLGLANIILYAGIYTPLKRVSIINTWIGAIVGAIPPIMGWTACTGTIDPPALLLGAILYAWQFPHFNSLSWNLREDYSKAGYRMMSVTDPHLNARVALRYAIAMFPLGWALPLAGITTTAFAATSTIATAPFVWLAWKFWKNPGHGETRRLFFGSNIYLSVFLITMMASKEMWSEEDKRKEREKVLKDVFEGVPGWANSDGNEEWEDAVEEVIE